MDKFGCQICGFEAPRPPVEIEQSLPCPYEGEGRWARKRFVIIPVHQLTIYQLRRLLEGRAPKGLQSRPPDGDGLKAEAEPHPEHDGFEKKKKPRVGEVEVGQSHNHSSRALIVG